MDLNEVDENWIRDYWTGVAIVELRRIEKIYPEIGEILLSCNSLLLEATPIPPYPLLQLSRISNPRCE
jgi:hypothetical protein